MPKLKGVFVVYWVRGTTTSGTVRVFSLEQGF
jgi:hypothetical protein